MVNLVSTTKEQNHYPRQKIKMLITKTGTGYASVRQCCGFESESVTRGYGFGSGSETETGLSLNKKHPKNLAISGL
jgi:hypothetical protein